MRNKSIAFVFCGMVLTGCTTDDFPLSPSGRAIAFSAASSSVSHTRSTADVNRRFEVVSDGKAIPVFMEQTAWDTDLTTRGKPVTTESISEFDVYAFHYSSETASPTLYFKETVENMDGTWVYDPVYYWPGGGSKLSFFGISGHNTDNGGVSLSEISSEKSVKILYEVPELANNQPDLIISPVIPVDNSTTGDKVSMSFNHLLSKVSFHIGNEMQKGTIKSAKITNLVSKAEYDHESRTWTEDASSERKAFGIVSDKAVNESHDDTRPAIWDESKTMMMVPQELKDCELEVVFLPDGETEEKTLTAQIPATEWEKGGSYKISINVSPSYNLEFVEESLPKTPLDCHYVRDMIQINVKELGKATSWTISSDQDWCTFRGSIHGPENQGFWIISPNGKYPDGAAAETKAEYDKYNHLKEFEFNSIGLQNVYVFLEENTLNEERVAKIHLKVNGKIVNTTEITQVSPINTSDLYMEQYEEDNDHNITDNYTIPWGFNWTGTFYAVGKKTSPLGLGWISNYTRANNRAKSFSDTYKANGITINYQLQNFIIVTTGSTDYQPSIKIEYGKLDVSDELTQDDGKTNTYLLFTSVGGNIDGLVQSVNNLSDYFEIKENSGNFENNTIFAANHIIKKNAFTLLSLPEYDSNGKISEHTNSATIKQEDVKWYLPAISQNDAFPNGNGDYWSSSQGVGDGTAMLMTNGTSAVSSHRSTQAHIRAVRNK